MHVSIRLSRNCRGSKLLRSAIQLNSHAAKPCDAARLVLPLLLLTSRVVGGCLGSTVRDDSIAHLTPNGTVTAVGWMGVRGERCAKERGAR